MPFKTIKDAKDAGFPTKAEGKPMTLVQVNKLADIYDALKNNPAIQNAMAVAWTQWKKMYKKTKDAWVKIKRAAEKQFKKKKKKKCHFINPISMSEFAEPPREINILKAGEWNHPSYGPIKITGADLDEFVKNFNKAIRRDLPIDVEHKTTDGAVGWFKKLFNKGKSGLWATVEWTKQGKQLLKDKVFKYFSPEFYSTYEDPESGKIYKNVLVGGALTNRPYFKDLSAIVLSELTLINMDKLKEVLAKEVSDLTDEDKKLLKENEAKLTAEQKEKLKEAVKFEEEKEEDEPEETEEEKTEREEKEKKEKEEKEEKEKKASEGSVQLSEAALKVLERNSEEGVKAMAELRSQKAKAFVESFVFSLKNKAGLILPKSSEKVVAFLLSLKEEQAEKFKEILAELPKANLFKEIGKDELGVEGNANDQVTKLAEEKIKEAGKNDAGKDKLTFREALEMALADNPDLAKKIEQGY